MRVRYPGKTFEGLGMSVPGRVDPERQELILAPNLKWSGFEWDHASRHHQPADAGDQCARQVLRNQVLRNQALQFARGLQIVVTALAPELILATHRHDARVAGVYLDRPI
jgi:predicted NBD/HSP70 family sugar kinase